MLNSDSKITSLHSKVSVHITAPVPWKVKQILHMHTFSLAVLTETYSSSLEGMIPF